MKIKRSAMMLILGVLVVVATVVVAAAAEGEPTPVLVDSLFPSATAPNLVENPSFEGEYSPYKPPGGHPDCPFGICQTAQMAAGWTPWWRSHDPADLGYIIRMPEYKPATLDVPGPVRVHSGERAQQYFTFSSTHEAGFYQQIAVVPEAEYCYSIWGHSWSDQDDDPNESGPEDGELAQKVGIDPTGGTDWQSANIIWTAPRIQYDVYDLFGICATAKADALTIFTYSQPKWAVKHNDVYWDDAVVSLKEGNYLLSDDMRAFIAETATPQTLTRTLQINWPGSPEMSWSAALASGGTFTPTMSAMQGVPGESLSLSVESGAYASGVYSTTLTITSEAVPEGEIAIPLILLVSDEIHESYLPAVRKP